MIGVHVPPYTVLDPHHTETPSLYAEQKEETAYSFSWHGLQSLNLIIKSAAFARGAQHPCQRCEIIPVQITRKFFCFAHHTKLIEQKASILRRAQVLRARWKPEALQSNEPDTCCRFRHQHPSNEFWCPRQMEKVSRIQIRSNLNDALLAQIRIHHKHCEFLPREIHL